jgi:hypothetical protein
MNNILTADKVLYLDYDGVLHDGEVYRHPRRGIYVKTPGRSLFEWMPILEALLAPYPQVAIVLSTSWVRVLSFQDARQRLSPALQARVIGATYHRRWIRREYFEELPRGVQVVEDVRRRQPKNWFALDDETKGWPDWAQNNLIATDPRYGISDPTVQRAIEVMLQKL